MGFWFALLWLLCDCMMGCGWCLLALIVCLLMILCLGWGLVVGFICALLIDVGGGLRLVVWFLC